MLKNTFLKYFLFLPFLAGSLLAATVYESDVTVASGATAYTQEVVTPSSKINADGANNVQQAGQPSGNKRVLLPSSPVQASAGTYWNTYQTILDENPTNVFVSQIDSTHLTINAPINNGDKLYLYDSSTLITDRTVSGVSSANVSASSSSSGATVGNGGLTIDSLSGGWNYSVTSAAASSSDISLFEFAINAIDPAGYVIISMGTNAMALSSAEATQIKVVYTVSPATWTVYSGSTAVAKVGWGTSADVLSAGSKLGLRCENGKISFYLNGVYKQTIASIGRGVSLYGSTALYKEKIDLTAIFQTRNSLAISSAATGVTKAFIPSTSYTAAKATNNIADADFVQDTGGSVTSSGLDFRSTLQNLGDTSCKALYTFDNSDASNTGATYNGVPYSVIWDSSSRFGAKAVSFDNTSTAAVISLPSMGIFTAASVSMWVKWNKTRNAS